MIALLRMMAARDFVSANNTSRCWVKQDVSNETKSFIREKMRSAVDLLRNIEHRRQTIYKVVESIVHRQQEFLDKGVQYIKPMMLKKTLPRISACICLLFPA